MGRYPSLYLLQNGDNLVIVLVTQPLIEDNYNTWSRSILVALNAKNKIEFIAKIISEPCSTIDPLYSSLKKINNMVLSWLLNSLSKDLVTSVIYVNTAREVWVDLKHKYSQGNGPRIFELCKTVFSNSRWFNNQFLLHYIRGCLEWTLKLQIFFMWHQTEECTMALLMGLNKSYGVEKGQILLKESMFAIHKVFSLVL